MGNAHYDIQLHYYMKKSIIKLQAMFNVTSMRLKVQIRRYTAVGTCGKTPIWSNGYPQTLYTLLNGSLIRI